MPKPKKTEARNKPATPVIQDNVLPDFPISWTSFGVYLEAAEEDLSCQHLVELVNTITLPRINVAVIDVPELIDQEILTNSDLSLRLKFARQEFNEKKKKGMNPERWMPPSLLVVESLKVRAVSDRDIEHKKEAIKRRNAVEEAKSALQTAKDEEANVRSELLSVETSLQSLKDACSKAQDEGSAPDDSLAAKDVMTQPIPMKTVGKEEKKGGKSKPLKEKVLKEEHSDISSADAVQKLELLLTQTQSSFCQAEEKVSAAEAVLKATEASQSVPYVLTQVYILVGLGNDPTSLMADLAAGSECRLCAVLLLTMVKRNETSIDNQISNDLLIKPGGGELTSLAARMKELARSSGLDDPARQIAVIDVQYDGEAPDVMAAVAAEEKQSKTKKKKVKEGSDASRKPPLPYDNMAKAVASCLTALVAKLGAYEQVMRHAVQCIQIPAALPSQDLDVKYYNELLQHVPENLVSVPIILHCILEQTIVHSLCRTKSESTYFEEEKKKVGQYLTGKLLKFGLLPNMTNESIEDKKLGSASQIVSDDSFEELESSSSNLENDAPSTNTSSCIDDVRIIHEFDIVDKVSWKAQAMHQQQEIVDVTNVTSHFQNLIWVPGKDLRGIKEVSTLTNEERCAFNNMVQSGQHSHVSTVQVYRKLKILLESLLQEHGNKLETLRLEESVQSILDSQFIERFPNQSIADVYLGTKMNHPFERLVHDEVDNSIVSIMYAIDGEYEWNNTIPSQVSFHDFASKHEDMRPFHMSLRTYKLEDNKSQIYGKTEFYLPLGDSLFSYGFPSVHRINKDPQGTLYMDGNVYILRSKVGQNRNDLQLCASFKDGLSFCFFREERAPISLQISTANGITIEINSHGLIYMLKTNKTHRNPVVGHCMTEDKQQSISQSNDLLDETRACSKLGNIRDHDEAEDENWRCILPKGVVISNKAKGCLEVLYPNGNVSERTILQSGWITTNSKGYQVIQVPPAATPAPPEVGELPAKPDDKIEEKPSKAQKESKQKKKDIPGETVAGSGKKKKGLVETGHGGHGNNSAPNSKSGDVVTTSAAPEKVDDAKIADPYEGLGKVTCEDSSKPTLYLLPRRRVVQIADMQTECHIESREDLVTMVRTKNDESIVYHSDGTSIYACGRRSCVEGADPPAECEQKGSIVWQVQKEGYPTVYSNGSHTMFDLATEQSVEQPYKFRWCEATGEIHVSLPQGKCCIYTKGNSVILDASRASRSMEDGDRNSGAGEVQELDIWEHSHVAVSDSLLQEKREHLSGGLYVFNLENGTISHEEYGTGNGFHVTESGVFQRHSVWEAGGKGRSSPSKERKRAHTPIKQPPQQELLPASQIDAVQTKPPPRKKQQPHNINPKEKKKQIVSALKLLDKLRTRKPTGSLRKGPSTRIFVFQLDGGAHGYEILGKHSFDRQLEESCAMHLSEEIENDDEFGGNARLHTFVLKRSAGYGGIDNCTQTLSSSSAVRSTTRGDGATIGVTEKDCAHVRKTKRTGMAPISYGMPPVLRKGGGRRKERGWRSCDGDGDEDYHYYYSYRQVTELGSLDEEQRKRVDQKLQEVAFWELDLLVRQQQQQSKHHHHHRNPPPPPPLQPSASSMDCPPQQQEQQEVN